MLRIFIAVITCILLSLIPYEGCINVATLNILYGVIGVLFSVGMSLIISFNGSHINNPDYKKSIRESLHDVRNNFLCIFSVCTFFYVIFSLMEEKTHIWVKKDSFTLISTWSISCVSFIVYSIVALISNYLDVQKLYEDIDDMQNKEKKK